MIIQRYISNISALAFVLSLLIACSTPDQSSQAVNVASPQEEVSQVTSDTVDELDDETQSQDEDIEMSEEPINSTPEEEAEVPYVEFDPESTKDGMVMVYVPQGEFEMGTNDEQKNVMIEMGIWDIQWNTNEQPVHSVFLNAFWIDQTEVTSKQYALCVADGACEELHSSASNTRDSYYGNPDYEDYPVTNVDRYMAETYCTWAGRRLPTEAEWEKAARGTDGRLYPWGDVLDHTLANYGGADCDTCDTTTVGSYPDGASPYGALDMAGNVWEWVADVYDKTYYANSPTENPLGPVMGSQYVLRGGSWMGTEDSIRSGCRYKLNGTYVNFPSGGFRCAASP